MPLSKLKKNKVKSKFKLILANICIITIIIGWTCVALLLSVVVIPGLMLTNRADQAARVAIWLYARWMMKLLAGFIPVTCNDLNMVKANKPCILVANHLSFLDLFLFAVQNESNLCMLTKAWPFRKLFFFAPIMRLGNYLNVESMSVEEVTVHCHRLIAKGVTIIAFPEGQRSRNGKLGSFHSGAFKLAVQENIPIVSMVIQGSYQVMSVDATSFTPGSIHLELLPPIYPAQFAQASLPHRAMMRYTKDLFFKNINNKESKL